jgi:hypothetical protein
VFGKFQKLFRTGTVSAAKLQWRGRNKKHRQRTSQQLTFHCQVDNAPQTNATRLAVFGEILRPLNTLFFAQRE